jgi:hypothetical protein
MYLEGKLIRQAGLLRAHQGPLAILNAAERLSSTYASEVARAEHALRIAESQVGTAALLRRRGKHAGNWSAEAAQRLHMDGTNESGADERGGGA